MVGERQDPEVMTSPFRRSVPTPGANLLDPLLIDYQWRQIRIVAGGDSYRLTPRAADRAGHRSNQRTELYQTSDLMPDDPYSPTASADR